MTQRLQHAMNVLAIETATEACSAAVLLADGRVVERFTLTERSHAELILPMIDEVLAEAKLTLAQLDGLAFGRGPGGFTGVRVAAGVIQGLAFGSGLKVAPVSSLAAVAARVRVAASSGRAGDVARGVGELTPLGDQVTHSADEGILVCNDARMHEVYWAAFGLDAAASELRALTAEHVTPPDRIDVPAGVTHCAGNALVRYPDLRRRLEATGLRIHDDVYPHAAAIARLGAAVLARGEGVTAADALPTYVRDDVARPPGGTVTTVS